MERIVGQLAQDRAATTAIEYAFIAAMISLVIVSLVISIGNTVTGFFVSVGTSL